jgi:hypothetical protein
MSFIRWTSRAAVGAERLREFMADLADRCAAVVQRYGGTVGGFTGDGIMAVFGSPAALEDHAVRARRAALGVQEEAKRLAAEVQDRDGIDLRLRVGLNSGQVIAGEVARLRATRRNGEPQKAWSSTSRSISGFGNESSLCISVPSPFDTSRSNGSFLSEPKPRLSLARFRFGKPPARKPIAVGAVLLALAACSRGYAAHTAVSDSAQATQVPYAAPTPHTCASSVCGSYTYPGASCGCHL